MTATQAAPIPQTLASHLPHLIVRDGRVYCNHGNLTSPVVDSPDIPATDAQHIPRPDIDGVVAEALSRNLRLLLVGNAGCGKSSNAWIAARVPEPHGSAWSGGAHPATHARIPLGDSGPRNSGIRAVGSDHARMPPGCRNDLLRAIAGRNPSGPR